MTTARRFLVLVVAIAAIATAATWMSTPINAGSDHFMPWTAIPNHDQYGGAYLLNRSTGEMWEVSGTWKTLVKERKPKTPPA